MASTVQATASDTQKIITLQSDERPKEKVIGQSLYLFSDEAQETKDEDILNGLYDDRFVLSDRDFPSHGLRTGSEWARFVIRNESSETRQIYLESRYPLIDFIELFQKNQQGRFESLTLGDKVEFDLRPIAFRLPVFFLNLNPGDNVYYLRIKTSGTLIFSLFLWDPSHFSRYLKTDTVILSLAFGAVGVLLLYNIFLTASFRSKTYLWYSLYLIFYIFSQFGGQGVGTEWFTGKLALWSMNEGFLASIAVSNGLSCVFAGSFLGTSRFLPRWRWLLYSLIAANFATALIAMLGNFNLAARTLSPVTVLTSLLLISMGLVSAMKGFRPAVYYVLAWTSLLTANILMAMLYNGLFPMNIFVQFGNFFGGVAEATLISLALGDRINYLQKKSETTIKHLNSELTTHLAKVEALVEIRTETIRTIVDNVKSGFLAIGRDLRIEEGFTKSCRGLLGDKLEVGADLRHILQLSNQDASLFKMAVDQVFENGMHDDVALSQIPRVFRIGTRTLDFEGSIVRDKQGKVKLILFTVSDISRLRHKQKEAFKSSVLLKILRNRDAFRSFIAYTRQNLEQLKETDLIRDQSRANFLLHTIKGNCLLFNLRAQARLVHTLEEKPVLETEDIQALEHSFRHFLTKHESLLKVTWDGSQEEHYVVPKGLIQSFVERLTQKFQDPSLRSDLEQMVHMVSAKTVKSLLGPLHEDMQNLARRLHKEVQFHVEGSNLIIVEEKDKQLVKVLVHLVRNSLVHGIESNRQALQKSAEGHIALRFSETPELWQIEVEDDGIGMDLPILQQKLLEKGLAGPESLGRMELTEVLRRLSASGFSTTTEADFFSGRGVGLAAVFKAVDTCQGTIRIVSEPGQGSHFIIQIPRRAMPYQGLQAV